jgi:16S rRNA (cytosine1402-N4)-methyltransferase
VLLVETLAALRPQDGGRHLDGTVGGGGHSAAILEASRPTGFLYGCDRDGDAVRAATERLAPFAGRLEVRHAPYATAAQWISAGTLDGVLLDLGVSSHQLDTAERGFSFQQDGPLDMRMDRRGGPTAADLVNSLPAAELANIFWELGDERDSRRIARAIEAERRMRRIETTGQLAGLVERVCPRRGRAAHPATRVFQALRIFVNDELGEVRRGLAAVFSLLKSGGRLAVITFHSTEDRLVKEFMREEARDYDVSGPLDLPDFRTPRTPRGVLLTRKPILPGPDERAENPRARSAQLRVLIRS